MRFLRVAEEASWMSLDYSRRFCNTETFSGLSISCFNLRAWSAPLIGFWLKGVSGTKNCFFLSFSYLAKTDARKLFLNMESSGEIGLGCVMFCSSSSTSFLKSFLLAIYWNFYSDELWQSDFECLESLDLILGCWFDWWPPSETLLEFWAFWRSSWASFSYCKMLWSTSPMFWDKSLPGRPYKFWSFWAAKIWRSYFLCSAVWSASSSVGIEIWRFFSSIFYVGRMPWLKGLWVFKL